MRAHTLILAAGALLCALGWWQQDTLPSPESILPDMHLDPVQTEIDESPFETTVGEFTYTVEPQYAYELHGLVVSRHDADSWLDYLHKRWGDELNVADLCVLWGRNVVDDLYHEFDFSSGQFTCNFQTRSREAWQAFDLAAISNNHLLTDDAGLASAIRGARIGDQVRIRGVLANYSHGGGFSRGTSTVRTDTGNGACETVWVEAFEVLRGASPLWRLVTWAGVLLLAVGLVAWFRAPVRARGV